MLFTNQLPKQRRSASVIDTRLPAIDSRQTTEAVQIRGQLIHANFKDGPWGGVGRRFHHH
jgi:hypothetical protein